MYIDQSGIPNNASDLSQLQDSISLKKVFLKKNEERRVIAGHLWVFSNEIFETIGEPDNGDLVEVLTSKQKVLGSGFYNKNSLIAVRLLSSIYPQDLFSLLRSRITAAYNLRKELYPERESFRMVFSESDFLPGLIIDKYNNSFVLQVNSYGMEKNIDSIIRILKENFNAETIFSKHDPHFRTLEGLPIENAVYLGEIKDEIIDDGKIKYEINFSNSQKTGFFFDQSDNRFFIEKLVQGKKVMDAFCNSGGFGLHALAAGASSVEFADISESEIKSVEQNYILNSLTGNAAYTISDIFDLFVKKIDNKEKFDVVMIDPPAFTKGRKNLPQAKKGYEKLNRLAMELLNDGGYLVTSSCSFHLDKESFLEVVSNAASKLGKTLQLLHFNNASLDHPRLPGMPETTYLKFGVFKLGNI